MSDIIKIAYGGMQMALENEVMKAVCKVGINVNKEELLKALELSESLVRCAECKHWHSNTQYCDKFSHSGFIAQRMLPNDFCSLGERKESE